jgi:hypothetical protein
MVHTFLTKAKKEIFMNELPQTPAPPSPPERPRRRNSGWIFGVILILIGGTLLAGTLTDYRFDNWWAFFILIPGFGSFASAWNHYQAQGGQITRRVTSAFISGLFFVALTAIFLFNLDWEIFLPVVLILFGISALASAFLK